jgi:hypothetical protein
MPLVTRPRNGLYLDDCAPHFGFKVWHAVAILGGMFMWLVLIFAAVAIYRFLRGGA